MPRSVDFVIDDSGIHWLPRPDSWIKGLLVHRWFELRMQASALQASPDHFGDLTARFGIRTIVEADDGSMSVSITARRPQENLP